MLYFFVFAQCARHSLLRCHLDNADGAQAREVMAKYASIDGDSVTFGLTRVFIEIVSLNLEEEGSSLDLVNSLIEEGTVLCCTVRQSWALD